MVITNRKDNWLRIDPRDIMGIKSYYKVGGNNYMLEFLLTNGVYYEIEYETKEDLDEWKNFVVNGMTHGNPNMDAKPHKGRKSVAQQIEAETKRAS